jgi:hypothetical protein
MQDLETTRAILALATVSLGQILKTDRCRHKFNSYRPSIGREGSELNVRSFSSSPMSLCSSIAAYQVLCNLGGRSIVISQWESPIASFFRSARTSAAARMSSASSALCSVQHRRWTRTERLRIIRHSVAWVPYGTA